LKAALKKTNQHAGSLLARGHYGAAEGLVAAARLARAFKEELEILRRKWRDVSAVGSGGSQAPKSEQTPLWGYYRPILEALAVLDGQATLPDLERQLESSSPGIWKPGDLVVANHGRPRWKIMVKRARRAMVKEGWLELKPLKRWRLTDAGRKAAQSQSAPEH
jgi:nucleotide-binding universal stress UspA family protein